MGTLQIAGLLVFTALAVALVCLVAWLDERAERRRYGDRKD